MSTVETRRKKALGLVHLKQVPGEEVSIETLYSKMDLYGGSQTGPLL